MNFSSPGGRESFTLGHIFSTFLLPPKGHLGGLATPFFFFGFFFPLGKMKPFWGLHNFSTGWFNHQPVALLESVERWVISSLLTLGGGISEEMWYPTTWFGSCQDLLGDTWLMTMVRSVERPLRESGCGTPSNWLCMAAYFRGVWSDHDPYHPVGSHPNQVLPFFI